MRTWGIAVVLAVLVLASCGGDPGDPDASAESADSSRVAAGDCLDIGVGSRGITELMYRTDALVDCEDPHGAEVVAVETLPDDLLTRHSDTEEYRASLVEIIASPRSPREMELASWVRRTCSAAVAEAAGLDQIKLGGSRALLLPAPLAIGTAFAFPEEEWEDEPRVMCLARFNEPNELNDEPQDQPNVEVEGETLRDYLTADFPVELRNCVVALPENIGVAGPCTEPHHSEILFSFAADDVLDDAMLEELELNGDDADPAVLAELDELCTEALPVLLGPDYDDSAVVGFGDLGGGWTGAALDDYRFIDCSVSAADPSATDLAAGSLIGTNDAPVETVPRRSRS